MSENKETETIIKSLNTMLNGITKQIEEENDHLKEQLDNLKDPEIKILTIYHMIQNNRSAMHMNVSKYMVTLFDHIMKSLEEKANKTHVNKKSDIKDLERIRLEFTQQFKEQSQRIEKTIKPLSDEITKTLERQERNKDVYK